MSKNNRKRAYGRLSRLERSAIEEGLSARMSIREIAQRLGRSPSTIANEIHANRTIERGGERGQTIPVLPEKVCGKLMVSPGVCNTCKYHHHPCGNRLKVEYSAARADRVASMRRSESRTGVDRSEAAMALAMSVIRSDLSRGLSPTQIAHARKDELNVSATSIYRWIDRGYHAMSNLELRRQVGYRPRKKKVEHKPTSHGKKHSYEAFSNLSADRHAVAVEMDTVIGTKYDSRCILTLYLRPSRFQLMILLSEKTSSAVTAALDSLETILGPETFSKVFGLILTDNGCEFADMKALERSCIGSTRRTTVYYCDVRQSQQKARCERNHVELRKLVPKGRGIRFDRLSEGDMGYLMSQVNSIPRPSLMGVSPIQLLTLQLGKDATRLLDAFGVGEVTYDKLDLTETSIDRNRVERGEKDDPLIPA